MKTATKRPVTKPPRGGDCPRPFGGGGGDDDGRAAERLSKPAEPEVL
ncbi:MAG UNVERIFIED_CONTAM: hypothetical protein LVR18_44420 [Planctomycetaceae bacterium]